MKTMQRNNQAGAVSIFVVIFSALLVTIVTISFVSVMIRNQQQASNADLSNSAYDAALAGVEDAKRLLLVYRECQRDPLSSPTCPDAIAAINDASQPCNTVKRGLYNGGAADKSEVLIQRQVGGDSTSGALNQAYTCVRISYLSDDLKGSVPDGESQIIPVETAEPYDSVRISWFKKTNGDNRPLVLPAAGVSTLPTKTQWSPDPTKVTPPIMRAQWIQTASTFNNSDFDFDNSGSDTNTLFLYPSVISGVSSFMNDSRPKTGNVAKSPSFVRCVTNAVYQTGEYACSVKLSLPQPINGGARTNTFLQLAALYNAADYRIELLNSTDQVVKIVGPVVDSTGRANDLFRRVEARVNFAGEYPRGEIDIDGDLCKNFSVTDRVSEYVNSCPLTP